MTRRFTKACTANGYAAMGRSLRRPHIAGATKSRGDIKAAIELERKKAARMIQSSKRK